MFCSVYIVLEQVADIWLSRAHVLVFAMMRSLAGSFAADVVRHAAMISHC